MPTIFAVRFYSVARLFGAGMLCLSLISGPVTFDAKTWEIASKTALAKKGGDKGGGKDRGGGRDRGERDRGDRGSRSERSVGPGDDAKGKTRGNRSLSEVFGDFRSGKAFGAGQRDHRIERAKDRYSKGLQQERSRLSGGINSDPDAARVAHQFSAKEADALIGRGWKADQPVDGFANHGDRVRTMVELAKALGYSASVGALQANFGTPTETGIAALQRELTAARAEAETNPDAVARIEELEAELAAAIQDAKPGQEPTGDWATANLDVNNDGIVDRADLAALGDGQLEEDDDQTDAGVEVSEDGDEERDDTMAEAPSN